MKLGVVIDGNSRFIAELLQDWRGCFQTECFEFNKLVLPFLEGRVNQWRYKSALRQFLVSNDVVFFEWAAAHLVTASHLETRTPVIVRLHSWELFEFSEWIRWNAVSRVVLVSEAMRNSFLNRFPEQAAKTDVVYPGKSLSQFRLHPRTFGGRVGMVCDLTPIKRVYELILSLHELNRQGYDLTLHLAGEPPADFENQRYFASLRRAVNRLGLGDRVVFHGWVADPASWLQNIDIFISNSYWEGLQNALIEAMATGCYCLAHFWEGVEEILPQKYICVSARDLEEKIAAYCRCPDDEKWAHQIELRQIVGDRFNVAGMLTKMRKIILETAVPPPASKAREGDGQSALQSNQLFLER